MTVGDPYDALERELVGAVARAGGPAGPRRGTVRSRRRSGRVLAIAVAVALLAAAAALAAGTLLSTGAPVPYRYGAPPSPDRHYGATVAGSVQMLAEDVPDPAGGLAWGLRAFTTSRGYGCIQIGRVQDGKLGVLAIVQRGGAIRERNRFHELPPAVATQATTCIPLDGAGHAFLAVHAVVALDGNPAFCEVQPGRGPGHRPACPEESTRTIDAGLLGPRAIAITYRAGGTARTAPTLGDVGGYLVVQRPVRPATVRRTLGGRPVDAPVDTALALTPAGNVVTRVDYAGAPACAVHPTTSIRGACFPAPGLTPIPQPTARDVRAPIHAFAAPGRRGVRLRFRAPVAVADGRSDYNVTIRSAGVPCPRGPGAPRWPAGQRCGTRAISTGLDRNIAAGTFVRTTIDIPNVGKDHRPWMTPGTYWVDVTYRTQPRYPRITGSLAFPGLTVGTTAITVRRR